MSLLVESPEKAPVEDRQARAPAPAVARAGALHHAGSFEGWGWFVRLLLWSTRANRKG